MNTRRGQRSGVLRAIAHRPADGEPMVEVHTAQVEPGRGISAENRKSGEREITLLSAEAWAHACSELGVVLPWHTRRANLLIEGLDLGSLIGSTIQIGPVRLLIHGETKPCGLMEKQHAGLRKALEPYYRGGVHGEVLAGGVITVGDAVTVDGCVPTS